MKNSRTTIRKRKKSSIVIYKALKTKGTKKTQNSKIKKKKRNKRKPKSNRKKKTKKQKKSDRRWCLPRWRATVRPWYELGGAEGDGNSGRGRGCTAPWRRPCRPWQYRLRLPSRPQEGARSGTRPPASCTPRARTRGTPTAIKERR